MVGLMGVLPKGGLLQSAAQMSVTLFFLLLIVRKMPSKTEEYNRGNVFSHVNILVTAYCNLLLNPALNTESSDLKDVIQIILLTIQVVLMVYLFWVSIGKLRLIIKQSKLKVIKEQRLQRKVR
eukprot:SAG31_NODE_22406_length_526_cov_1.046838_1_plen_122_part_01